MDTGASREKAKTRIENMVKRLRSYADSLEKLSQEIDGLTPEAEEALWQMSCGRFNA